MMDRRTAIKYIASLFAIPFVQFLHKEKKLDGLVPAEVEVEVHAPKIIWEEVSMTEIKIEDSFTFITRCCATHLGIPSMQPPEGWTFEDFCNCGSLYRSTQIDKDTLQIVEYRKNYV